MQRPLGIAVAVLLGGAAAAQQGPFMLMCSTLPFETIKRHREIDQLCDLA